MPAKPAMPGAPMAAQTAGTQGLTNKGRVGENQGEVGRMAGIVSGASPVSQDAKAAEAATTSWLPGGGTGSSQAPGATSSGYLNFGDFANANSGVAKREAGGLNQKVSNAAQSAQNALQKQEGGFYDQAISGMVGSPDQSAEAGASAAGTEAGTTGQTEQDWESDIKEKLLKARQSGSTNEEEYYKKALSDGWEKWKADNGQSPDADRWMASINAKLKSAWDAEFASGATDEEKAAAQKAYDAAMKEKTDGYKPGESVVPPAPQSPPPADGSAEDRATDQQSLRPTANGQLPDDQSTAAATSAAQALDPNYWAKQANGKYSGPGSMQDTNGYGDLLQQTTGAQAGTNAVGQGNAGVGAALGAGTSADAALLGAFGRPDFAKTSAKYSDLSKNLDTAQTNSAKAGQEAKETSDRNAAGYGSMLSNYNTAKDAEATKEQETRDKRTAGINAGFSNEDAKAQAGVDLRNEQNSPFGIIKTIAEDLNPIDWALKAAGQDTLEGRANKAIEGGAGVEPGSNFSSSNGGLNDQVWTQDDTNARVAYNAMSDSDKAEWEKMSNEEKRQWIQAHNTKPDEGG